jgi:hypothetical protein
MPIFEGRGRYILPELARQLLLHLSVYQIFELSLPLVIKTWLSMRLSCLLIFLDLVRPLHVPVAASVDPSEEALDVAGRLVYDSAIQY